MQKINEYHSFTGMQRDIDISKHPSNYLYDARNIRLTSREDDTLLAITNERGTKETQLYVNGLYLGHCLLNQYLVIFSKDPNELEEKPDYITRIDLSTLTDYILYNGNLRFSFDHPIEAISSYENESIQKVYWTDGYNQPRMINIVGDTSKFNDSYFDFIRELALNEKVSIQKQLGTGRFAPGVIQYAFTYYTKYGQESNIFYTSPLQYISFKDRGASPEEMVENAFRIKVENVDTNFDFLRIYSIHRTSLDDEVSVKRIQDINLKMYSSDYTTVPYITSTTKPPLVGNPIKRFKSLLGASMDWYCYSKEDYPYLNIYTSEGYVTWDSDNSGNYIWVSVDQATNINDNKKGYIICCTDTLKSTLPENIKLSKNEIIQNGIVFTDTGNTGDAIDPSELLYKGGQKIIAQTLEQKDNTLFLGNITLSRDISLMNYKPFLQKENAVKISKHTRSFTPQSYSEGSYVYGNQLSSVDSNNNSVPCAGFKRGDYYRCGVQFQYKDGSWSAPVFIKDVQIENHSDISGQSIIVPTLTGTISNDQTETIKSFGYRKVRAVVVYPNVHDRMTYCQGVICPTLYTEKNRDEGGMYAQSSWFFRPVLGNTISPLDTTRIGIPTITGAVSPMYKEKGNPLYYTSKEISGINCFKPFVGTTSNIRQAEIQGEYSNGNKFRIEDELCTLHSPDIEFDDFLQVTHFTDTAIKQVGKASFIKTLSDIDIQTESPTISNNGTGFFHKSFTKDYSYGIVAGLFYDDYVVDDHKEAETGYDAYINIYSPSKWLVYPWNRTGSLNNDINRPANKGTRTAVLKKKVISNLRYANTIWGEGSKKALNENPQLFVSNEVSILKFGNNIYEGNIDTLLSPDSMDGMYYAFDGNFHDEEKVTETYTIGGKTTTVEVTVDPYFKGPSVSTDFNSNNWWKTFGVENETDQANSYSIEAKGLYKFDTTSWGLKNTAIGNNNRDLILGKDSVRMKYKSTAHMVFKYPRITGESYGIDWSASSNQSVMPIVEIVKNVNKPVNLFGGESEDALKANVWIPCGEPVTLGESFDGTATKGETVFEYSWGDTYYQRYDCLKTYPFTPEDINQIVEIGSFMLETHINIDGRYDRNRGQLNNLNMTPQNFNLINPVYSQTNNFFTYRILDDDYYNISQFSNQITWSKEKQAGADVDLWTNVTLASTYDMDGSKGEIVSLNTWKDQIFCFQNKGICNILFNSRVQIPVSDGNPIEITNNYKVDGYRYIADGIGCNSKLQIKETPSGVYFIDSVSRHLYKIAEGLQDVSSSCNMTSWFKNEDNLVDKLVYDDVHHDLYLVNSKESLCFSEVLGQFTSFMDYDNLLLLESYNNKVFGMHFTEWEDMEGNKESFTDLYEMFAGRYNDFFGHYDTAVGKTLEYPNYKPWHLTFITNGLDNGISNADKTFTNIEFRASVGDDGELNQKTGKFTPSLPFNSIETWDEYQHGIATLKNLSGSAAMSHPNIGDSSLKRKFRIWRCDIPRNNAPLSSDEGLPRLSRKVIKPIDRMRNPWLYVKLQNNAEDAVRTAVHDMVTLYYV